MTPPEPNDYMSDIEIQHEHEDSHYDNIQGLSDEQVAKLAHDALTIAELHNQIFGSSGSKTRPPDSK